MLRTVAKMKGWILERIAQLEVEEREMLDQANARRGAIEVLKEMLGRVDKEPPTRLSDIKEKLQ